MKFRLVRDRIFTSMLALGFVGATFAMGARSVSAQSLTVATPFPFCVDNQAFPKGTYAFTPLDHWILSIRNVNGGSARLFLTYPKDRNDNGWTTAAAAMKRGGVTFRDSEGVQTLKAVYDPSSDVSLELPEQGVLKGGVPDHQSPNEHNCATKAYIARNSSAGK